MSQFAKLRSDLISAPTVVDGQTCYHIKDPITGSYFQLREPEFWLINRLDGKTSPEEIAAGFKEKFGFQITAENVGQFVENLRSMFFIDDGRTEQEISRAAKQAFRPRSLADRILFLKIKGFRPGKFLDKLNAIYKPFHRPFWFFMFSLVILSAAVILFEEARELLWFDLGGLFALGSIAAIVVSLFIIIVFHEFAHAVVCRHYGGEVREMGFLLMYFQPCFYCDVSDSWLFPKKSQRLAVTMAGPFYQLLLTAFAIIVWRVTVPGAFINEVVRIIAGVSLVTYLFNFNPLIKLDGYYLLSDWLDIVNLRSRAFDYTGNIFKRMILGWPIEPVAATKREKRAFLIYAILASLYSFFLIVLIIYILGGFMISHWGGAGFLLLVLLLFFILRNKLRSLARGIVTHVKYMKDILKKPGRLISYIVIAIIIIVLCVAIPFPNRVSGEIFVNPIARFDVSLSEYGFLQSSLHYGGQNPDDKMSIMQMNANDMGLLNLAPLVADGQQVMPGDTLAILTSNQISQEILAANAALQSLEGELMLLKAPPKQVEVDEAQARVAAALAAYDKSQKDYERAQELAKRELISPEQLEGARSKMDIDKANWQTAVSALDVLKSGPLREEEIIVEKKIESQKARLEFLQMQGDARIVTAPIAGVVFRNPTPQSLLSVINHKTVEVLIPVSDFEIGRVQLGQKVSVKIRTYPNRTFEGTIVRIPEAATQKDGRYFFEVSAIMANEEGLLREGMSGYAKIETGKASLVGILGRKVLSKIRVEFWSWW